MKKKRTEYDKIAVSVNGKRTLFQIGDHLKFHDGDTRRCVTKISVDSDGCVSYLLTFLDDNVLASQWMTENDFNVLASLGEEAKTIGFH